MASFFGAAPAPVFQMPGAASTAAAPKAAKVLSSDWTGLNQNLLARLYPVKRDPSGNGWSQSLDTRQLSGTYSIDDRFEVHGPITDGNSEISAGWISPFEGAGAESKAPTLSALLQSGVLSADVTALLAVDHQQPNYDFVVIAPALDFHPPAVARRNFPTLSPSRRKTWVSIWTRVRPF
jgi:hypothetical protein